jgi:cytochrome c oxidase subunit 3
MAAPTSTVTMPETTEDVHDASHGHPSHLQHHFVSSEQQFDASKMGMWLFLLTEILLFSGMFVAYTVYRVWHPEVFYDAAKLLDWRWGAFNTLVLLGSSFTVALSIHFAQKNDKKKLVWMLFSTFALACVFLVVKYIEYSSKFEHGIFAGTAYNPDIEYLRGYVDDPTNLLTPFASQFFSIYFVMTGIHGVHVLVGMGVFAWITLRAMRGEFTSEYYTPVELAGLYWHLVDIIWIFLFPLLYLM